MSKLLTKQFRAFTWYALIVLFCSIPAYFFIVENIWMSELDEHNKIIAIQTQTGFDSLNLAENEIPGVVNIWNRTRPGSNLTPVTPAEITNDSTYEIMRHINFDSGIETDRFRGLVTYIRIYQSPYRLTIETNVEESEETISVIAMITIVFFLIMITGFIILNKRLAAKIWKPFNNTLHALRSFDLNSKEDLSLDPSDITEFDELNKALTRLVEKNSAVYREQKEFTENASHELQTPLAIIQSKLDLLIQTKELTAEQSGLVEQVNKTLSRIAHLNKNLLLLTKIDNNQYNEMQTINVSELALEMISLLSDVIHGNGLEIETVVDKEIQVTANKALLEILINNVLSNAIRHTSSRGSIVFTLSAHGMEVRNSGALPLNKEALFKRFTNVDPGRPGSGLGLAIMQQICSRHGWSIDYTFANGSHRFSVTF